MGARAHLQSNIGTVIPAKAGMTLLNMNFVLFLLLLIYGCYLYFRRIINIQRHPNVKAIAWGHVHQVFEADRHGIAMLGSPSSAINGLPGTQKFTPDLLGPACRWLSLKTDGVLLSGIV